MFLPQNNSGNGNGSEMVTPFTELVNTYENARSGKGNSNADVVSTQKPSLFSSIFGFMSRRRQSNQSSKVVDATA